MNLTRARIIERQFFFCVIISAVLESRVYYLSLILGDYRTFTFAP